MTSACNTLSNPSGVNTPNIPFLNPPQVNNQFYASTIGVGYINAVGGNGKVVIIA
jgi:hypothetical protein